MMNSGAPPSARLVTPAQKSRVVEAYAASLARLSFNSKPIINELTHTADAERHAAPEIVQLIESRVRHVPANRVLPVLYLLDSILKNVGGVYREIIEKTVSSTFVDAYRRVDVPTRKSLARLVQTWGPCFPEATLNLLGTRIQAVDQRSSQRNGSSTADLAPLPVGQTPPIAHAPEIMTATPDTMKLIAQVQEQIQDQLARGEMPTSEQVALLGQLQKLLELQTQTLVTLPPQQQQHTHTHTPHYEQPFVNTYPLQHHTQSAPSLLASAPPLPGAAPFYQHQQQPSHGQQPTPPLIQPPPIAQQRYPAQIHSGISPPLPSSGIPANPLSQLFTTLGNLGALSNQGGALPLGPSLVGSKRKGPDHSNARKKSRRHGDTTTPPTLSTLKAFYAPTMRRLNDDMKTQCDTCGLRFPEKESLSPHLDWHFRINRRQKEKVKRPLSRAWFPTLQEWVDFQGSEVSVVAATPFFEQDTEGEEKAAIKESAQIADDSQTECPVCGEVFDKFWDEDEEEWMYRDTIRHDEKLYHVSCNPAAPAAVDMVVAE
eukprot:TRINITY_DN2325_c2_g1_i2.p1 TRINITY_DN2325_c2_g1~~TRINITY_DN2325_c2_g1_i2.p1  ORF type:complete len:543 (-),score=80.54 TRINITY_DN2325_c2_g1_i2:193-1821(-)